nr:hypothetical protein [Paraburkholderia aspalathi]
MLLFNFGVLVKLVLLDLTLGVNNAALIVPTCLSVPPVLRRRAVLLGTAGAIVARAAMLALASLLVGLPGVDLVAGAYLLISGYRLLVAHDTESRGVKPHLNLWTAAGAITLSDMVMSVDNVLAVAATAHGLTHFPTSYAVVAVCCSIPVIMFGSGMLAHIVHRFHVFMWAGGGLLGYVGFDMVLSDPLVAPYVTWSTATFLGFTLPIALLGAVVVIQAALLTRRRARRLAGETNMPA